MKDEEIKKAVREGYAQVARQEKGCCGPSGPSFCCGGTSGADFIHDVSKLFGYTEEDLYSVPEGSNLGLGCGNPVALASLKQGEVVLDLGSGAGFDCFLAARRVGEEGKVIGVDMTPEMVLRARENAARGSYTNVEFRLGEIEHLPVSDASVDVIISNCVINLSPDKAQVFREAFRALRPGGRLMISDLVLLSELPGKVKNSIEAYIGCLAGAIGIDEYLGAIREAGFEDVKVVEKSSFPLEGFVSDPTAVSIMENLQISPEEAKEIEEAILSVKVCAMKKGG